jgi:Lecithin:cholesterol acyltransferase
MKSYIAYVIWFIVHIMSAAARTPVLLFPGLGASRLLSNNNKIVYPPLVSHYLLSSTEWHKQMIEDTTLRTLDLGHKQAVDLSVSSILNSRNIYANLAKQPHIHPIPYDFRRIDDQEYVSDLCTDIRRYVESQTQPVELLCHSTGGLVAHWFLHQQTYRWRAQWIKRVANMNVPFGGTVSILSHCVNDQMFINKFFRKDLIQSLGATVWNMPNRAYLKHPVLLTSDGYEIEDYMGVLGLHDIQRRWFANRCVIESFGHWTGVDTEMLYSSTLKPPTINQFVLGEKGIIEPIYGGGDGVVTESSLFVPKQWGVPVTFTLVRNSSHSDIVTVHGW